MMEPRDRCRGALLGLATGDALGTTLEFRAPGSFKKIDDMVGGAHSTSLPLAQLMERQPQSTSAGIWALSGLDHQWILIPVAWN